MSTTITGQATRCQAVCCESVVTQRTRFEMIYVWGASAPAQTGGMSWMKEPYGEGVAPHTDPESCAVVREGGGEALTGARAGRVLSRENQVILRAADALGSVGRQYRLRRYRETRSEPARSETPSTYGNILHGSREIPRPPATEGVAGRIGKSEDARR